MASSAAVIGASMSGLLAARALMPHFDRVTLVERDVLPDGPDLRKGTPQAAHAHGLLAGGYRVIDGYFPGLMDDLEALGAPRGDVVGDFLWFQYGRWKLRYPSGLLGILVSRPCLEAAVRERVKALPGLRVVEGVDEASPSWDAAAGRVTGLDVRQRGSARASDRIDADLVVDATGRGSQAPALLERWGFGRPETTVVTVNVGYATRLFERRPADFHHAFGAFVSGTPATTRYAAVLAAEGGRYTATLAGTLGDYPPATEAEWTRFAGTLPVPLIRDFVTSARPLSGIATYRFPSSQRRLYEKMARFPDGYLVIGDAVCSFNPIYAQGMSAAALQAKALDDALAAGRERLARRFFRQARAIIDMPWTIATGEDLRFPQVEGRRPPGFALVNRYLDRVHAAASDDPVVCRRFFDVLNLLAPPAALMSPPLMWRVLARRAPRGVGSPLAAAVAG
jgi:2-polyprenyl-6-methoxyphenol hydroxylase-like FAD-dependent oxidoreductase